MSEVSEVIKQPGEYKQIVETRLGIKESFLNKHRDTIATRLLEAHGEMTHADGTDHNGNGADPLPTMLQDTIYGINHCIHLASSLVLLGSEGKMESAMSYVQGKGKFIGLDPTTVLTIATLYYVMQDYLLKQKPGISSFSSSDQKKLQDICRRFDMVNWMIGTPAMRALGIKPQGSNA